MVFGCGVGAGLRGNFGFLEFSGEGRCKSGLLYPTSAWGVSFSRRELVGEEHQQGQREVSEALDSAVKEK